MATRRKILIHFPLGFVERFVAQYPQVEFISVPHEGEVPAGIEGEALLTYAWGTENLGQVVERGVRWIHTIGTGVDRFPMQHVGDRQLTCARGASATPIAEWVLTMMLAFEKQLPDRWISEPPREPERWNFADLGGLQGKTLGLVGFGTIAQAVATRALAFEMSVVANRRRDESSPIPGVEIETDFYRLLPRADHLVIAAAATEQTQNLLDAEAFARMKPGVHVVNIARGSIVDQDALQKALDGEVVARASLDVCTPEPLPEGHWLYSHPRVRLSPHISWSMPGSIDRILDTFGENLARFLAGEPLAEVVDVDRGY